MRKSTKTDDEIEATSDRTKEKKILSRKEVTFNKEISNLNENLPKNNTTAAGARQIVILSCLYLKGELYFKVLML